MVLNMLEDLQENTEELVQKQTNIAPGEIIIGSLVEINDLNIELADLRDTLLPQLLSGESM